MSFVVVDHREPLSIVIGGRGGAGSGIAVGGSNFHGGEGRKIE